MKKAILILLALVVLGAGALAAYLTMNAGSIAAKLKPEIEKAASQALGSEATLGDMSFSVYPRTRFTAASFQLGAKNEGLSLGELDFEVRLMPLLSGNMEIVKLALRKPQVSVVKDAEGAAVAGLPKKAAAGKAAPVTHDPKAPAPAPAAGMPAGLKLDLESFEISDGTFSFNDKTQNKEYKLEGFSVKSGLSLSGSTVLINTLELSGKTFDSIQLGASGQNINLALDTGLLKIGSLEVSLPVGRLALAGDFDSKAGSGNLSLKSDEGIDLGALKSLEKLSAAFATLKVGGKVKPDLTIRLGAGTYQVTGNTGLTGISYEAPGTSVTGLNGGLTLDVSDKKQEVKSAGLKLMYNGAPIEVSTGIVLAASVLDVNQLNVAAFAGTLNATAQYAMETKLFKNTFEAKGLDLVQLQQVAMPGKNPAITGTLESLKGNLAGKADDTLKQSIIGSISLLVKNGELPGVNLVGPVMKAISSLPMMAGGDAGGMPAEASADRTVIKSLSGNLKIGNGRISTPDLKLESSIFSLEASGTVGFDSSLDLNASILFNSTFSQNLASRNKGLQKILDAQGRLVVPLVIKGTAPKLMVLPDVAKLATLGAQNAAKEAAGKLLGNALGGGKGKGLFGF